jgi:hypothetical protein
MLLDGTGTPKEKDVNEQDFVNALLKKPTMAKQRKMLEDKTNSTANKGSEAHS